MDEIVARALARWPDVPAVYGWLRLDARGVWQLRNPARGTFEPIGNAALRAFIARNYSHDAQGRWFFQNGPQRVYVELELAPLVLRLEQARLVDHCGRPAGEVRGAWLDDAGGVAMSTAAGAGSLDDRDLARLEPAIVDEAGRALGDALEGWMRAAAPAPAFLALGALGGAGRIPLGRIARAEMPGTLGFVAAPRPGD